MKKIWIIAGLLLLIGFVFTTLKLKDFYTTIYHAGSTKQVAIQKNTIYNILLLGYGGGNHDGTYLTDSIMVIHLDTLKKKALLISLPRDLWVNIPTQSQNSFAMKINSTYEMGLFPKNYPDVSKTYISENDPALLSKHVVSEVLGIPVTHYIAVDFDGFKKVIDNLGGLDIDVDTTFDDYEYPIDGEEKNLCGKDEQFAQIEKYIKPGFDEEEKKNFLQDKPDLATFLDQIKTDPKEAFPCRYEHLHFDKGVTHMNGETALKYARSRHSLQDGSDFGRAKRQQKVLLGAKDKALSLSIIPKIIPLMDQLKDDIQTDLAIGDIKNILLEGNSASEYKVSNLVITNENYLMISTSSDGQSIVTPKAGNFNWDAIRQGVKDAMLDKVATPSATFTPKK